MMPSAPSGRRWRSGWRQREADPLLCRFLSCFSTKSLAVCLLEGRHRQTAVLGRQWARERGRERCFWWGAASLSRYWIQIPNSRESQPQAIDKAGWSQCVSPNSLPIWLEKAEDMMLSGHTCLSSMQIKGFGSQSNDTLFFTSLCAVCVMHVRLLDPSHNVTSKGTLQHYFRSLRTSLLVPLTCLSKKLGSGLFEPQRSWALCERTVPVQIRVTVLYGIKNANPEEQSFARFALSVLVTGTMVGAVAALN